MPAASADPMGAATGVEDAELAELLITHWEDNLRRNPIWATQLGDHRYDDRIRDESQEALQEERAFRRKLLERAKAIDPEGLLPRDQVTLSLFVEYLGHQIAREQCHFEEWSISPRGNPVTAWSELPQLHPIKSDADGKSFVARLDQAAQSIDTTIANMRLGKAEGWYPNRESTRRVLKMTERLLGKKTEAWAMTAPAKEHEAIRADVLRIAEEEIRPAFERYEKFLEEEILPQARSQEESGLAALPFGEACYGARVAAYTTLPLKAETIHETGLAQMERINAEMKKLGEKLFGTGELKVILEKLRTDESLYFESAEQIEEKAKRALAAARAAIPKYFGRLPEAKCVVRRIPDYEAPYTTIAYYREPVPDGSKPGEYFVNVYEPTTRPKFEAEALAFHESIPGHHLQIAIAQELPDLPAFRKHVYLSVFGEGWALYTEQLAREMGLYGGDLDLMGMYSFEAWRAARLVVDTGIHAMGWSRERAKKYMAEHTALALNNIDNEVDRYIVWPAQALSYMTGQLEILRLRREAEQTLGDRFDLAAFHDVVLGGGAVSMPVLRRRVAAWVSSSMEGGATSGAAAP